MYNLMNAVRVHRYGGPAVLTYEAAEIPAPAPGEVLVRVKAATVLPADVKTRKGAYHSFRPMTFPYVPGAGFAGVVENLGAWVTDFVVGQRVFGRSNHGAYAEYTVADAATAAPLPDRLSFADAATISGGATTAWVALMDNGNLQPEQRVLITGASGGVGSYAVQFAKLLGAFVFGTASEENLEYVRQLGADVVLDYRVVPFDRVLRDVDLVIDTVGGDMLTRAMDVVKRGGTVISLTQPPSQEQAIARGIYASSNNVIQPFPSRQLLKQIADLIASGQVRVPPPRTFPLEDVQQAHELCESGRGRGRIVLLMGN